MKNNLKKYYPYILTYIIIFVLLIVQHSVVSMYFDDFGNASLSYSKTVEGVIGTDFNFSQLFDSAVYTYNNFGGRVLYGMFASALLKNGITIFMMLQCFIIVGIIANIHSIVSFITKKKSVLIPIFCMVLYMLFDVTIVRHGNYWASASILYVWPMLPMLTFMNYYIRTIDKIKNNKKVNYLLYILINIILIILSVFSQEQLGVMLIAFLGIYIMIDHILKEKEYLKYDLVTSILTISTYLFLFLAPGNWKRLDSNTEFADLSFFEKIKVGFPRTFDLLFKVKTSVFINIFVSLLLIYIIHYFITNFKKSKKYYLLLIPIFGLITNFVLYDRQWYYDSNRLMLIGIFIGLSMLTVLYIFHKENKDLKLLAFPVCAACSVFCLMVAPYISERCVIPCIFILFISIIYMAINVYNINNTTKTLVIIIGCLSLYSGITNYIYIYRGYKANLSTNNENYSKFKHYKKYLIEDENVLKLCKVKNSIFGSSQPYEQEHDYWLQQYFDIPEEITFEWNDCNE